MHGEKPAYFITFTYDDENNPGFVCKSIAQSLKKRFAYYSGYGSIMIITGEYGERTGRPHYHLISWLEDDTNFPYDIGRNVPDQLWSYGHIEVYPATPANISYTCGYEVKNGKVKRRDRQAPYGFTKPFTLYSRGISKEYAEKFGRRDMELGYTPVFGQKRPVSRYIQTHSGHCDTFLKIWRAKKNRSIVWKFGPDDYDLTYVDAFLGKHPKGAILLPKKILLSQIKKDAIIVAGKEKITEKKL
jgi:hypothetical protein